VPAAEFDEEHATDDETIPLLMINVRSSLVQTGQRLTV
jgi:hypothetical protein